MLGHPGANRALGDLAAAPSAYGKVIEENEVCKVGLDKKKDKKYRSWV